TVNQRRGTTDRLDKVWFHGIAQQNSHATLCTIWSKFSSSYRLTIVGFSDHDARKTSFEVVNIFGQAEDRHGFGSHGNLEVVFARRSGGAAAQANGHVSQVAVVHIQYAFQAYGTWINSEFVAVENVVIHEVAQQVVGRGNGVEVTCEVQVDVFHGYYLGVAAAGSTTLHTKNGTQRWLAQGHHGLGTHQVQGVGDTD